MFFSFFSFIGCFYVPRFPLRFYIFLRFVTKCMFLMFFFGHVLFVYVSHFLFFYFPYFLAEGLA